MPWHLEHSQALICAHLFTWALMIKVPRHNEHSWVLMVKWHDTHCCSEVLRGACECFWMLRQAVTSHKGCWVIKCWIQQYTKNVNFQNDFDNMSVQISLINEKLDIFKIYSKRAVVKCPRCNLWTTRKPRNSRTKVETVLLDTLYLVSINYSVPTVLKWI